jgi:hypothetical protein
MGTIAIISNNFASRVRRAASRRGSTLIWVMVVVLVMIVALGIGLTAVSGQLNLSSVRHEEHQAYYTALSSTETVAAWIAENTVPDDKTIEAQVDEAGAIEQLLQEITDAGAPGITIDEAGIPPEAGTCTVNLRWLDGWPAGDDEEHTQLKITSVATFAGVTETVSLTLIKDPSGIMSTYGEVLEASDFSPDDYAARVAQLEGTVTTGIVAIYDDKGTNNTGFNDKDVAILNNYISADSTIEARWTNSDLLHTVGDGGGYTSYSNSLGTQRFVYNSSSRSATDERRFMVPENGRITIDPLERDGYGDSKIAADVSQNTSLTSLAIDNTDGKNVLLRLASGDAARIGTNKILYTETSTVTTGTFNNWTSRRFASLVTLDFTDNAGSNKNTENLTYTVNGSPKTYTWHPNNWNKLDILVRSRDDVSSNLAFGPFAHKYYWGLDYEGKGEFTDNWHGNNGEFAAQWPYVSGASTLKGLPYFPVDYGKNANFWILDSPTYELPVGEDSKGKTITTTTVCYVWFIQGTNILGISPEERSTIYSRRATVIGGALIRAPKYNSDGKVTGAYDEWTSDGLNRGIYGFANQSVTSEATYVEATTRYSQLIYNTDIMLMPPSDGNTAYSLIRRPNSWRSRANLPTGTSDKEKLAFNTDTNYEPTMTIKGGTIYVGERQHLTIQGTSMGYKDGTDYKTGNTSKMVALDNMWISPDKIVVAAGGTLLIETSVATNIITDIYVDGGTLIINAGAKIKGNIYAYNGGTVKVNGSFRLDAPGTLEPGQEPGGILIYGEDTLGTVFGNGEDAVTITTTGRLDVPAVLTAIDGNSGRIHLVGGDWADLVTGTKLFSAAKAILCDGYDPSTGRCPHYDGIPSSGSGSGGAGSGGSTGGGSSGSGSGGGGGSGSDGGGSGGGPGSGVSSGGGWIVGTYSDS